MDWVNWVCRFAQLNTSITLSNLKAAGRQTDCTVIKHRQVSSNLIDLAVEDCAAQEKNISGWSLVHPHHPWSPSLVRQGTIKELEALLLVLVARSMIVNKRRPIALPPPLSICKSTKQSRYHPMPCKTGSPVFIAYKIHASRIKTMWPHRNKQWLECVLLFHMFCLVTADLFWIFPYNIM